MILNYNNIIIFKNFVSSPAVHSQYDPNSLCMAEREGFEPSIPIHSVYTLSKRTPSTTRPPLLGQNRGAKYKKNK
ncbi:hypothetical protein LCGC14_1795980 [marine sediment metagenome]|uniref:Uncharacterized protein n=1 Tax=marine sediment metagenome TaxID=412755 RepID=A0A0F9GR37_9ZZZZ